MTRYLRTFQVNAGTIAADVVPTETEDLYCSPDELFALFGCRPTEADVRHAQVIINSHCNRATLWPAEYQTPALDIPSGRQETRLGITPVISITEAAGRYALGRRDHQGWNNLYNSMNPLLVLASTGIPQWQPIDTRFIEVDASTGVVYLPWSSMLLPFTLVRLRFIAGLIEIPFRVKAAVNEIINSTHARGVSDRMKFSVGRISRTYSSKSFLTPMAEQYLQPWVVTAMY